MMLLVNSNSVDLLVGSCVWIKSTGFGSCKRFFRMMVGLFLQEVKGVVFLRCL